MPVGAKESRTIEKRRKYDMSKKNKDIKKGDINQQEERKRDEAVEHNGETDAKTKVEEKKEEEGESEAEEAKKIEQKLNTLLKENEELKASVAKEKDDYIRLMADFENFRRHSAEAKLELVSSAAADTIKGLLPVLDDCERAMKMLEENSADEVAKEGTALIFNKLMGYLKTKGLEVIKAKGEKFDTDFHEAVAQFPVPEEDKKGLVYDVVQTGYTLSGKVIRYAKVVVGI